MIIGTMEISAGVLILSIVVVIEAIVLSKGLAIRTLDSRIFNSTLTSNIASTLLGLMGFLSWAWDIITAWIKQLFGLPKDFMSMYFALAFIIIAFLLTLPIEGAINILILKRFYKIKNIIKYTIYSNSLTYFLLGLITLTISYVSMN